MIAQSVADILGRHVTLAVEGIDRMYLNVYVPRLQSERGVVGFFREHRDQPLPSAALMSAMSRNYLASHSGCGGIPAGGSRRRKRSTPGSDRRSSARASVSKFEVRPEAEDDHVRSLDVPAGLDNVLKI
jgi:hypothetical protein